MPDFPDYSLQAVMGPAIAYNWAPYHSVAINGSIPPLTWFSTEWTPPDDGYAGPWHLMTITISAMQRSRHAHRSDDVPCRSSSLQMVGLLSSFAGAHPIRLTHANTLTVS
jgi:hypothetical protein